MDGEYKRHLKTLIQPSRRCAIFPRLPPPLFPGFIGVMLVNTITQVSGAQLHNTFVHCIEFTTPSQVCAHCHLFSLYPSLSTSVPSAITTLLSVSMSFFLFFTQSPHPAPSLASLYLRDVNLACSP